MSQLRQGHALVIGIDAYGRGISSLQSAVADAKAIAELLAGEHGYAVEHLLDTDADRASIERAFARLPERLSEESAFLLYFAGHGVARGDGNVGPQGFLLPADARPSDVDSWLSMEWLRKSLEALPCRHLLVVLDCCFAGSFRWASTRAIQAAGKPLYDSQFERYLKGVAWQALTSASADEKALDVAPGATNTRDGAVTGGHSPFAAALMRGLSGAADSSRGGHEPDGVMTATELFQFVFEELVPPGADAAQTPGIWPLKPDNRGQYIFRNPKRKLKTVPDPPLDDRNNPWLGLKAYTEEHRRLFFGRDRVIEDLQNRLADGPGLLAVLGASGTGKSSVIKAGLIPRLRNGGDGGSERETDWGIVQTGRLGERPIVELDAALAELDRVPEGRRRLLFIDQFEELYTQSRDAEMRDAFLARLRRLIDDDRTTVLCTLRSDFEPRPAASRLLRDLWSKSRYVVPAFSLEEYRDCIEGPAREKAVYFEPASLVDELLDEVAAMPGALPMLSFALAEIYRNAQVRRRATGANDRALTQADYEATGGMVGAMHRRATVLYEEAEPDARASIERVFLRMLSVEGDRLARRRVRRQELEWPEPEGGRVEGVLRQYIDARLLVADGEAIEPAHDTLVAAWELLLDWRRQAQPQELLRALWRDTYDWATSDRDSDLLWDDRPERLAEAESRAPELNRLETDFTAASRAWLRRKRRRRWGIAAGVAIVIGTTAFYGFQQFLKKLEEEGERYDAQIAREKLFLEFHGDEPHVFTPNDVLDGARWSVVEPLDDNWEVVIGGEDGALAVARNYSPLEDDQYDKWAGRILAMGHDRILRPEWPGGKAERFLEHSMAWLETDPESPVYISVGHGETLPGLPSTLDALESLPESHEACIDEREDWFLNLPGIRLSLGPDDPLFAASLLHVWLWEWDYCQIYAVSDLTVLDSDDVAQGVLIIADAREMDELEIASARYWVEWDDNGLLVTGSGAEWTRVNGGDPESYPMNRIMSHFRMRFADAWSQSER